MMQWHAGLLRLQSPMNDAEVSATNTRQGSIRGSVDPREHHAEVAHLCGLDIVSGVCVLTLVDGHRFVPRSPVESSSCA